MDPALLTVNRHQFIDKLQYGLKYTVEAGLSKDNNYTLFRREDWAAWAIFTCVFGVLIVFDNCVLNRRHQKLTVLRASLYTSFWILCACAFCGWVALWKGTPAAFSWMSGYILEWMLSFDNLFVFHLIFTVYGTPDSQKHRPLYLGICGAIFFRLVFIFIGEFLMHAFFWAHIVFGAFLVYTGVKTVTGDDDDEDPSQNWLVCFLHRHLPFVGAYDKHTRFFVQVPVNDKGEALLEQVPLDREAEPIVPGDEGEYGARYPTYDFSAVPGSQKTKLRATMLVLVVICLEVSDVLFAVDSVSAIVAQVNDLYLAYTSAVFAMLGLRATFFIIDVLVQLFSLLKYGVAAVLVFVGIKLMVSKWYHIPASIVCVVLVVSLASSMIASVVQDEFAKKAEGKVPPEIMERVEKVKGGPSPVIKNAEYASNA